MSLYGILILVSFILIRLFPEIITLAISYDAEYTGWSKHTKIFALLQSAVYLIFWYTSCFIIGAFIAGIWQRSFWILEKGIYFIRTLLIFQNPFYCV